MHRLRFLAVVLVSVPFLLSAQSKKPKVPAVFDHARYVWVEAVDGDQFKPSLLPEDRQAISDVEEAIRDWNRYALTASRSEAELVFIVRKGRVAAAKLSGSVGAGGPFPGQQRPIGAGAGVGTEVGPPDDLLEVCQVRTDGTLSGPLWMRTQAHGLDAPDLPLLDALKKAIERDYPRQPASQPKKP